MSTPFQKVLEFIENLDIRISSHGYDELAEDGLLVMDILSGVREARIVEDYPAYPKGPGVLILQKDLQGNPIHVLWGIPRDAAPPAVLITAYRPDPKYWSEDYMRLVHEGQYVAEVDIELIDAEEGWAPYLSLDDAQKLDDVREALRRGDLKHAARLARVFSLTLVKDFD